MTIVHNKIGFHAGIGGNAEGLSVDYLEKLDGAGVPFFIKSTDSMAGVFDGQVIAKNNPSVPHICMWRSTETDVPNYNLSPADAAQDHWDLIKSYIPPELDREIVWIEPINEVDKNLSDWMGNFAYEISVLANNDGYKVALFGWSSGEPEPDDWEQPGMLRFLNLCAARPERVAISLHEYSYVLDDIMEGEGYLLGRFNFLHAVCDAYDIARPTIFISEWGWVYNNVPDVPVALDHIAQAAALYAPYPNIKGCALWYLGGGFGGIANRAQPLIAPVGDYTVNEPLDVELDEPTTPPVNPSPEPLTEIYSMEDWYDDPLDPARRQVPTGTTLEARTPGQSLRYAARPVTGTIEATVKLCDSDPPQLPQNECPGGSSPLVLDGMRVYKMQAVNMAVSNKMTINFGLDGLCEVRWPVNVHYQGDHPYDREPPLEDDDVFVVLYLNGEEVDRYQFPELVDRSWITLTGEAIGPITAELVFETTYATSRDLFTDKVECIQMENSRGAPRVQYNRTYVVIPPEYTEEQAQEVFAQHWAESRTTVGGSYDDAGIGDLENRRAILYGIPRSRLEEFELWYDEHYPGVVLEFMDIIEDTPAHFSFTHTPIECGSFTQGFGENPQWYEVYGLPGHDGLDWGMAVGHEVYAVADGEVVSVHTNPDSHNYGLHVRVGHVGDYLSIYCHLSFIAVNLGETVSAGDLIGLTGNTGNTTGAHFHLGLKRLGHTYVDSNGEAWPYNLTDPTDFMDGLWPVPCVTSPPPPVSHEVAFGLHASADSMPQNLDGELNAFQLLAPDVIKVLSYQDPSLVGALVSQHPNVDWIIRAFLSFGGRNISPGQFYTDTISDMNRTIGILRGNGVSDSRIWIELHNEPNLTDEGWMTSWSNGSEFNNWLLELLGFYRSTFPNIKMLFPGLSPGGHVNGIRYDSTAFINECAEVIEHCDGIAQHAYWAGQNGWPMSIAINEVEAMSDRFPNKPIWLTEASNNKAGIDDVAKGNEYITFWNALKTIPDVRGVTYFVASATNPSWNWNGGTAETWVGTNIPGVVSAR